jgi:hypothetical protein
MCTTAFSTPTVCDKALCPTFILKPSLFYQDRLRTNIGNTQQKDRFLRYILLSSLGARRKQHDHESVASSLVVHLIALLRHFAANRCSVSFLPIVNQSNAPGADGGACHWFDQAQQVVFENNTCTGNNPMVSKAAAAVSKALCRVVGCVLCLGWTHAVLIGDGLCCVRYYCPLLYRPWETTSTPVSRSSVHTAAHAAVPLCCAVLSISQAIAANKMGCRRWWLRAARVPSREQDRFRVGCANTFLRCFAS